jgi:hypothetical protein
MDRKPTKKYYEVAIEKYQKGKICFLPFFLFANKKVDWHVVLKWIIPILQLQ